MRALVTGSEGFIGRHMVKALCASYEVTEVDLKHGDDCREFFARDASDTWPRTHYDLVVHCAAMVDGREAIEGKAALLGAYNLQLDGAMWEWALRTRPGRVVYFSSSAAYPVRLQSAFHFGRDGLPEWTGRRGVWGEPDATYGWVKLTGEMIAEEVRAAGVPVTVLRPFSGYGEDQDDCYPFPAMMQRARERRTPFVVWGDGKQVRDFIHVDDVVGATLALVAAGVDGPVNVGTGLGTSMDDLALLAMSVAGYDAPIQHLEYMPSGVNYRVASIDLLRHFYVPQVTLLEGVKRALA